jgi:hypothetical protein
MKTVPNEFSILTTDSRILDSRVRVFVANIEWKRYLKEGISVSLMMG